MNIQRLKTKSLDSLKYSLNCRYDHSTHEFEKAVMQKPSYIESQEKHFSCDQYMW